MNPEENTSSAIKVSIVSSCVVVKDGNYLMVKERIPEKGDLWHPPSGKVDEGEDFETAAVRWTKQQTGYDVQVRKEIGLYHEVATKSIKHVYAADIVGGELVPQNNEIVEVAWLPFAEIEILEKNGHLRAPWVWSIIQKVRSQAPSGSSVMGYL